jgi:hypothetical protein
MSSELHILPVKYKRPDRKFSVKAFEEDEEGEIETIKDVKEQIVNAIGGFGKWQLHKCLYIVFFIWMPASFHLLNMVFFR